MDLQQSEQDSVQIRIKPDTKKHLEAAGKFGESFDDVIRRVMKLPKYVGQVKK